MHSDAFGKKKSKKKLKKKIEKKIIKKSWYTCSTTVEHVCHYDFNFSKNHFHGANVSPGACVSPLGGSVARSRDSRSYGPEFESQQTQKFSAVINYANQGQISKLFMNI